MPANSIHTLPKAERLYEKKLLDKLFLTGQSIDVTGLKLLWLVEKQESLHPVKVAFSVPKRIFKSAVKRNLLKRRMREAYRKNKLNPARYESSNKAVYHLIFIHTGRKLSPYSEIESKIVITLQRLKKAAGIAE